MENVRFEYTSEGYLEAKQWLEEIKQWDRVSRYGFSTDGWSIVSEANSLWERTKETDGS